MDTNKNYPKILLISDASWSDTNNIGNTFSNLFSEWPKEKIAMVYARPDLPNTNVCNEFFQISESRLIKGIINKNIKAGRKILSESIKTDNQNSMSLKNDEVLGQKIYKFFTKHRWNLFLTIREILWKLGNWKTDELDEFISSFNPDIIFSLACSSVYMNDLQQYIIKKSDKKSVIYFVDDVYSVKRFSLSPLFWLNRFLIRRSIRETVRHSQLIYTIVPKQKQEYDKCFEVESKILNKGGTFKDSLKQEYTLNTPLKLVYTGNIYAGRWETLVKIGNALDKINGNKKKANIYIYTQNQLHREAKKAFSNSKSIHLMGGIPASEVKSVQKNADILVHVESFQLKQKLSTRLSFSTKLVDYFEQRKCILAVGWCEAASIEYLRKNDIAVVVDDVNKINIRLKELLDQPETIQRYGLKSWTFGKENHDIHTIKELLRQDMVDLMHSNDCNR